VELDRFQDASSALLEFLFTLPSALLAITFFFGNFVYVDVIYAHPAPFLFNRLTIFLLWASLIALGSSKPSTKVKTVMPCFICSLRAVAEAGNNFLSLKKNVSSIHFIAWLLTGNLIARCSAIVWFV
jgi:hypothetical protein